MSELGHNASPDRLTRYISLGAIGTVVLGILIVAVGKTWGGTGLLVIGLVPVVGAGLWGVGILLVRISRPVGKALGAVRKRRQATKRVLTQAAIQTAKVKQVRRVQEQAEAAERVIGCQRCGGIKFKHWRRTTGWGWGLFLAGMIEIFVTVALGLFMVGLFGGAGVLGAMCMGSMGVLLCFIALFLTETGWKCRNCGFTWRE